MIPPDLARFARAMLASRDLDPVYPVLKRLHDDYDLDVEDRIWHTVLYLAYYRLPSSHTAWIGGGSGIGHDDHGYWQADLPDWALKAPTGIERRNLRQPKLMLRHLSEYVAITAESQLAWWQAGFDDDPQANWRSLFDRTQQLYGNGRWAAYKMGDLARYVLGWPVQAPDTGMSHSSGPRQGICLVYGLDDSGSQAPDYVAGMERHARRLQAELHANQANMDIDQVETILCDWKSLLKGGYYVGHDIDLMLEDVVHAANTLPAPASAEAYRDIMSARRRSLPPSYLGELHGWSGVDRELKRRYRDHGELWTRPEWQARRRPA